MKTKKVQKRLLAVIAFATLKLQVAYAQSSMEMKDLFEEVNDQVSASTSIIVTICYTIAGICGLVGAITLLTKLFQGREVGKDVGLWFGGLGIFLVCGFLCQKLMG